MKDFKAFLRYLRKNNVIFEQNGKEIKVSGSLDLRSLTSLPEGVSLTAGGWLDLSSLTSLPEGVSLTAGGWLDLSSLTSLPEGVSLTAGGWLYLRSLTSLPEGVSLTAGGSLYLSSLTSLPEGVSLTAGGWLYLSSLTSLPEGVSLTAGGSLVLRSDLKAKANIKPYTKENRNKHYQEVQAKLVWQNGKYRKIDGIFCEVLKNKGNIMQIKTGNKIAYIFAHKGVYAHGNTVRQAYLDWLFKTSDRDVEQYRGIKANEKRKLDFWVIAYRTITGACSFGTNNFLENNKEKCKPELTRKEVEDATKGQYGHNTFVEFYRNRCS